MILRIDNESLNILAMKANRNIKQSQWNRNGIELTYMHGVIPVRIQMSLNVNNDEKLTLNLTNARIWFVNISGMARNMYKKYPVFDFSMDGLIKFKAVFVFDGYCKIFAQFA